jgi:hypothetical protein
MDWLTKALLSQAVRHAVSAFLAALAEALGWSDRPAR